MPKYIVVDTHILHDGTAYAPGDAIELPEDHSFSLSVVPAPVEAEAAAAARKMAEALTVAELIEKLTALKVEIPAGAKKAVLVALYLAATDFIEG